MQGGNDYDRAIDLVRRGQSAEGIDLLLALQRRDPGDSRVSDALSHAFLDAGQFERALYFAERTLELRPQDGSAAVFVVHTLSSAGRTSDAAERGRALLPRFGHDPQFVHFVGAALLNLGRRDELETLLRDFLRTSPSDPTILSFLGSTLLNQGRAKEAEEVLRRSLAHSPGHLNSLSALATTLNYVENADRAEVFGLYREFGKRYEAHFPVIDPLSYENDPDPERIIRVGLVTSDLREHPVARFVEPILRHHDPSRVRITVYHTYPTEDEVSAELRVLCDEWRTVRTTRPEIVSRAVYRDRIDVLFELGGLTGNSSLPVMVPQVAPVQVSAIGYANTTGLSTVGYRIVDSRTDPPGDSDRYATERLVRLDPCFLCFCPRRPPAPGPSPVHASGFVTFGSFNSIMKYTDRAFSLWAKILERVPGSKLLLKNAPLGAEGTRTRILDRMSAAGISRGSVELLGSQASATEHLSLYDRLDVALDTFPYNGTTTTCEALVMGVPVVALEGASHAGRVGASLLHAAGMPEFLACTQDEYVEKAVALAGRSRDSVAPRTALREKLLASSLCDGPAYADRWQNAIRLMWRDWCERKSRSDGAARR